MRSYADRWRRPRRCRPGSRGSGTGPERARSGLTDRGRTAEPARARRPACGCPRPRLRLPDVRRSPFSARLLGDPPPRSSRVPSRNGGRSDEPIAVVAMACRYPGGVDHPDELWRLRGRRHRRDHRVPHQPRLGPRQLHDPDPDRPGNTYARHGGFLHDAGRVRPRLLRHQPPRGPGHGPAAAAAAGDLAGRPSSRPASTRRRCAAADTGIFAGVMYTTTAPGLRRPSRRISRATSHRHAGSVASGRIAYTLGPGGAGGHGRHRVLVLAGRDAPGRAGAAQRRVRPRPGRRRRP